MVLFDAAVTALKIDLEVEEDASTPPPLLYPSLPLKPFEYSPMPIRK